MKLLINSLLLACVFLIASCSDENATSQQAGKQKSIDRQAQFCNVITKYRNSYISEKEKDFYIDQESVLENIVKDRTDQLKIVLKEGEVKNWRGTISNILVSKGKGAFLEIKLSCNVFLEPQDQQIIAINSPLYEKLRKYSENSEIVFSGSFITPLEGVKENQYPFANGTFYAEKSFSTEGSMKEPEFIFKITEIGAK